MFWSNSVLFCQYFALNAILILDSAYTRHWNVTENEQISIKLAVLNDWKLSCCRILFKNIFSTFVPIHFLLKNVFKRTIYKKQREWYCVHSKNIQILRTHNYANDRKCILSETVYKTIKGIAWVSRFNLNPRKYLEITFIYAIYF
jgi:hypothetical protein